MSSSFLIRSPESSAEWAFVRQMLRDYKNEFEDETCFTSFEEEMNNIEGLYARPGMKKLIAVEASSGKIAGCVALRTWMPEVAEMKRLYVIPAFRGRDLGRTLAYSIIQYALDKGYTKMILDTMHEMKAAQKLYQQLGFHEVAPYHHQDPAKVVCYSLDLNPQL